MYGWKSSLFVVLIVGIGGAVMLSTQGIAPYWAAPIAGVVALVFVITGIWEHRENRKSFAEAENFKAGYAFKNQNEEQKYYAWAEKHPPTPPSTNMLADLIGRYRAPRLVAELLGVLALGAIEVILFKERAEGREEPGVIYIVLGGMILLLYFALSNIFGFRARRYYCRLSDRPDFLNVERSYTDGIIIGHHISYISIGSEYITLVTTKGVIPVRRGDIVRVCRANVLTAYYTNSVYSGKKESYFIKLYTSGEVRVQLNKFEMIQAYELLKQRGYRWLMIVTSDIEIDDQNLARLVDRMQQVTGTENVGLYQPSCALSRHGRALPQSLCHYTGRLRRVNFQEGWFHLVCRELLDEVLPVDLNLNRLGWGIDLALCHFARLHRMLVLVDDRVRVIHPKGRGYSKEEARVQMQRWHASIPGYESPRHFRPLRDEIRYC